jgi:hypothetical protein
VVIGTVMVVSSVITVLTVLTVDRIGRKALLLFGGGALFFCYLGITLCFRMGWLGLPVVLLTLACVAVYSLSLAPLLWVVLSEIFPKGCTGTGQGIRRTWFFPPQREMSRPSRMPAAIAAPYFASHPALQEACCLFPACSTNASSSKAPWSPRGS